MRRYRKIIRPLIGTGVCLLIGVPFFTASTWWGGAGASTGTSANPTAPAQVAALIPAHPASKTPAGPAASQAPAQALAADAPKEKEKPKTTRPAFALAIDAPPPAPLLGHLPRPAAAPAGTPQIVGPMPIGGPDLALASNLQLARSGNPAWYSLAIGTTTPRVTVADLNHPHPIVRSADLPVLALDLPADVPVAIVLPAGIPIQSASIDRNALFVRDPRTAADPLSLTDQDPAKSQSIAGALTAEMPLRQNPGAPMSVNIPDPDNNTQRVDSVGAHVDNDAPVTIYEAPSKPVLPLAHK